MFGLLIHSKRLGYCHYNSLCLNLDFLFKLVDALDNIFGHILIVVATNRARGMLYQNVHVKLIVYITPSFWSFSTHFLRAGPFE